MANACAAVDRTVMHRVLTPPPRRRDPIEALRHPERMQVMDAITAFYDRPAHRPLPQPLFTRGAMRPRMVPVRRYGADGQVFDLEWQSDFAPLWSSASAPQQLARVVEEVRQDAGGRAAIELGHAARTCLRTDRTLGLQTDYDAVEINRTMHARWFRHADGPRPCAVILHGYLGGILTIEERMWPVRRLFESGMDVVMTVLPMHGRRAPASHRLRLPAFPGSDPRLAIEGFRHMVHDHLTLFDYLLDGRVRSVGVLGMSLGGYSAALLSTLDPRLRFGLFYMPLASVADFALRTGRMVGSEEEQRAQAARLERTYRVVSPLQRPSLLPPGSAVVVAGKADSITGTAHAGRLSRHFDAAESHFHGSHILPLGRDMAFDPFWHALRDAADEPPHDASNAADEPPRDANAVGGDVPALT